MCGHEDPVVWDRGHAGACRWQRARRCVRCRRTRLNGAGRLWVDARRGRGTSQAGRRPDQGAILPEILQCVTTGDYSLCEHSPWPPPKRCDQGFYGTPEKQRPQNQRKSRHS